VTPDVALALARDSGLVILFLAGPILATALAAGLLVSVFQAVTQVQEATLTFIPKLVAVMAVVAVGGHWMLSQLLAYTVTLWSNLEVYGR
jgi:flagellar biosynthesis protein FliQ